MKRLILLIGILTVLIVNSLYSEPATKEDINIMLKTIVKVIEANNAKTEAQIKNLENEIKSVKAELQNQIKSVRTELKSEIKATNKRIDDLNNRIDDINNRIDDINNLLLTLLGGIFVLIGFIWWDRRTMISKAKQEVYERIEDKIFSDPVEKIQLANIIKSLKEYARKNKELGDIFNKNGISL